MTSSELTDAQPAPHETSSTLLAGRPPALRPRVPPPKRQQLRALARPRPPQQVRNAAHGKVVQVNWRSGVRLVCQVNHRGRGRYAWGAALHQELACLRQERGSQCMGAATANQARHTWPQRRPAASLLLPGPPHLPPCPPLAPPRLPHARARAPLPAARPPQGSWPLGCSPWRTCRWRWPRRPRAARPAALRGRPRSGSPGECVTGTGIA